MAEDTIDSTRTVFKLFSQDGVNLEATGWEHGQKALSGLNGATFRDQRWQNAQQYLQQEGLLKGAEDAQALLLEGARSFGIWSLSDKVVACLTSHVFESALQEHDSPGLLECLEEMRGTEESRVPTRQASLAGDENLIAPLENLCSHRDKNNRAIALRSPTLLRLEEVENHEHGAGFLSHSNRWWFNRFALLLILISSCGYALWVCTVKYKGILDIFGFPVFVARATAMAAAISTGIMYLSMARSFMKLFYRLLPAGSTFLNLLDGHKEIHIFWGKCLTAFGAVHAIAHLVGTVEGVASHEPQELNRILDCAQGNDEGDVWHFPKLSWLQYPACPLQRRYTYLDVVFKSTPGVTGLLLVVLLLMVGYTSHSKARTKNFDLFWYLHNVMIATWPMLLFVHGSNNWIGIGFPLVFFSAAAPIAFYSVDRLARSLRYYLYAGRAVQIVRAAIRPGKRGGPDGAIVRLEISRPPHLWSFRPGMYAFLCMPDYAPLQWHPFTISSGKRDEHVEFIIAGVGDWTQALAQRCLENRDEDLPLPTIGLDGPYPAPTQSAISMEVLVAVGAGVGITPFLSLMSTIVSMFETGEGAHKSKLKEAHLYWLTRSTDELLFGRRHFAKIATLPALKSKVFLHLHCTAREPDNNAAAYIFREVVRRQSVHDRAHFLQALKSAGELFAGPRLPWCWVNGSNHDVLWISHLTGETHLEDSRATYTDPEVENQPSEDLVEDLSPFFAAPQGPPPTAETALTKVRTPRSVNDDDFQIRTSSEATSQGKQTHPHPAFRKNKIPRVPAWCEDLLIDTSSSFASSREPSLDCSAGGNGEILLPVAFGRPDFSKELPSIGKACNGYDVHVYVCGNNALVKNLKDTCATCNGKVVANASSSQPHQQQYVLHYERFG